MLQAGRIQIMVKALVRIATASPQHLPVIETLIGMLLEGSLTDVVIQPELAEAA